MESGPNVSYKGTYVILYKILAYSYNNHSYLFLAKIPNNLILGLFSSSTSLYNYFSIINVPKASAIFLTSE